MGSFASEFDGLLAGAGYRVRTADLRHVAEQLEVLDSAMLISTADWAPPDPGSAHYNPSDLASWVDSMLDPNPNPNPIACADACAAQISPPQLPSQVTPVVPEEDSAIRLVRLLMACAECVQLGDTDVAGNLLTEMSLLLTSVSTSFGIGKVAGYFVDAFYKRLYSPLSPWPATSPDEEALLYHSFYEASPFLKFAHFTANQAILEAINGRERVHVIDFSLNQGLQWPALIQALALRPGGPPSLRLTGIGPPSPDGRDSLREIGLKLAELARSVNLRFSFRGIAANRLDDVKPWMLDVVDGEAIAINSVFQLHRILSEPDSIRPEPISSVLDWIVGLRPTIVTVVEQEAEHNKALFVDRFGEALFYYSAVFDSLEGGRASREAVAMAEIYLQREICDIVCCEGAARVERHETLCRWRRRIGRAGLTGVQLGSNAFKQASMLLSLFSGEGFGVEEVDGCLMLGWHNRALISASAWRGDDDGDVAAALGNIPDNLILNSSSNNNNNNNSGCSSLSSCSSSQRMVDNFML